MPDPLVTEIMRTDVPIVSPQDSIPTVARVMAESGLSGVPVVEHGAIVGIITEADLIAREAQVVVPTLVPFFGGMFVADAGRDFREELRQVLAITAGQLMSSPVYNIRSSATLEQVATVMIDKKVRQLPVVDDDLNLVGIVSRADLVRIIARLDQLADEEPRRSATAPSE